MSVYELGVSLVLVIVVCVYRSIIGQSGAESGAEWTVLQVSSNLNLKVGIKIKIETRSIMTIIPTRITYHFTLSYVISKTFVSMTV